MSSSHTAAYKKLVRLAARAFYSGECPPKQFKWDDPDEQTADGKPPKQKRFGKGSQIDTNHLGIVVLDALTRYGIRLLMELT